MQIFRELAGYSLGRADIVRRAMSKKKHDVMEREREIFIHGLTDDSGNVVVEGCVRRGVDEAAAASIFSEMESFASYAFNKSHAAAYAAVSYKTAWLKCHYPREYMAALLSSVLDNQNKLAGYIAECRRLGIDVLPPHVNESYHDFAVSEGNIRYGLLAIKNLGRAFIEEIIRGRVNGAYRSFYDFCKRLYGKNMNSRAVESLIRCGALDGLGANRRQMLAMVKDVLADLEFTARRNMSGQLSFFDMGETAGQAAEPELPPLEEFPRDELLHMENETAGIYFSGHPLDDYTAFAKLVKADRIGAILYNEGGAYPDGKQVCVVGVVSHVKTQLTKSKKTMARITVEDRYGSMESVVFPNVYERFGFYLGETSVVILRGTLNFRENEDPKLICESAEKARTNDECRSHQAALNRPPQPAPRPAQPQALYLRIDDLHTPLYERARRVLDIFDGSTPVIFYLTGSHRKVKAPASLWVSLNDVMLRELRYQLGDDNVAVR